MPEPLLTVDEVAAALRLERRTIYRYIKRRQLEAVKLPGRKQWRIRPEALRALLHMDGAPPCEAHPGQPLRVSRAIRRGDAQ